jgi:ribulose-phosphate 3-epimerase
MSRWADLTRDRLLADVSLWSADLANLEDSIQRVEPFADSYHIDVFDGRFVPGLLFFPDLVRALRPLTAKPFHVHLAAENPSRLIEDFAASGADVLTIHAELGEAEVERSLAQIRDLGREAGIALLLETPVATVLPYLEDIALVLLLDTKAGVKAVDLAPGALTRITQLDALLRERGVRGRVRLEADGAIRRHTVPLLRQAGADVIVPGSLFFGAEDLGLLAASLHRL